MGTQSAPNIVLTLIDISDGLPETGLAVVIVPYAGSLGVDDIVLSEIGVTGKYKKSTADGVDAVDQGIYQVYADSGAGYVYRGTYSHGGDALEAHRISTSDPHAVTAQQVSVTDVGGHFTGANIEAILQEIGVSIDSIPSVAAALLLDSSLQSVSSVKPKVTNLNADKVDGYHAGNQAGQLVVLGSDGKVPAGNLPTAGQPFAGDADTLDGLHQGQGSNTIPKWNSAASHSDLDTSLAGKKATGANNHLVLMSNAAGSPVADKLHTSFLQKKYPLQGVADKIKVVYGWGWKVGSNNAVVFDGVSFGVTFDAPPTVLINHLKPKVNDAGTPADPGEFSLLVPNYFIFSDVHSITETGFTAYLKQDSVNFDSAFYFGYTWIAIGVVS